MHVHHRAHRLPPGRPPVHLLLGFPGGAEGVLGDAAGGAEGV